MAGKGKGTKLTAEKEAALSQELTVTKKYQCLQAVIHPRMGHVEKIYITEDGNYYFSQGHELKQQRDLNPENEEDAKLINQTGRRRVTVKLPGTYINRKQVVDEISVEDFLVDKDQIVSDYTSFLKEQREKRKAEMAQDPDATVEFLVEALKK